MMYLTNENVILKPEKYLVTLFFILKMIFIKIIGIDPLIIVIKEVLKINFM